MELFENKTKGAVISEDEKYRYQLWRIWDETKPKVLFIMLNPSTADANIDDPTIRRCIGFAKAWGFGGFYVGNLFAWRATNPKELKKVIDSRGKDNDRHLRQMFMKCKKVVCAWGHSQGSPTILNLSNLYYLELSKDGTPKHPLYLRKDLKLKKWEEILNKNKMEKEIKL